MCPAQLVTQTILPDQVRLQLQDTRFPAETLLAAVEWHPNIPDIRLREAVLGSGFRDSVPAVTSFFTFFLARKALI